MPSRRPPISTCWLLNVPPVLRMRMDGFYLSQIGGHWRDLQLWRESGLEALSRREADADVTSARYRHAAAKYEALRSSLHYGDVVRQIARRLGESFVAGPTRC